jgi:hypothetical protein
MKNLFSPGTNPLEQTKSTPALDLIAKQKRCQAVQGCTREDEKHALRHLEILPCQRVLPSWMQESIPQRWEQHESATVAEGNCIGFCSKA